MCIKATVTAGGIMFVCAAIILGFSGAAAAVDYYVAPSGDDANPGTSPELAWKTLTPVNTATFAPGDRILFKAGSRHVGQFRPKGSGSEEKPIIVDTYGEGPLPRFDGKGEVDATVHLYNVEYWELNNLEISNASYEPSEGRRCGVLLQLKDFGAAHRIHLKNLFVRDISGRGGHHSNSGDGIAWYIEGETTPSRFDDLLIEGCHIVRTHLNGIWGWSEHWIRKPWFPSLNVIIRNNLLEDIGMSGIVPVGCDGALVEHNRVVRPSRGGSGIGIWPWSCDNTVIQFNEVSGSDGEKDGQAFDSDYNCRNSVFQYNYSHDNKGGFMLICTTSLHWCNVGCEGTVVRYNISQNDGATSGHIIHIAGPCKDSYIYNNTFYTAPYLDVNLIQHMNWEGYANNTYFHNNAVYTDGTLGFSFEGSTNNVFANNAWFGTVAPRPGETGAVIEDPMFANPGSGLTIGDTRLLDTLGAYRLLPGSPLKDKALNLGAALNIDMGTRDYFGNKVPTGDAADIGAHEYVPTAEENK